MAKTVLVLIVLVMFSIGLFIVSKVGVFLKESKKEASDEREGVRQGRGALPPDNEDPPREARRPLQHRLLQRGDGGHGRGDKVL